MSLVPPRPSPLVPGTRLDRYELLCPIADGGMASVWIARQTGKHGFQKLVAVKTMLPKFAAEERFRRMFVDEARIASRIEHVNVTEILDVGEQAEVTYLVMEYVDGDALSKVCKALQKKGVPMPPGVALRIMADVCGGLHAAHELCDAAGQLLGVVHRDVSPQNVLVAANGVAKVIDFGIAKARDRLAGDTTTDTLKGKVHYMPPEQALGLPVDRRADVWAVGAVLYYLLAGKPPYEGENDVQTIFLLTSGRAPPPLPANVPAAITGILERALAHKPEGRFASAAELQAAIEEAMTAAKLATSTSAVAAFLEQQVADRARKRQEAIALGLKAAAEREKYADLMKSNADADASGSQAKAGSPADPVPARAAEDPSSPGSQATLGSAAVTLAARDRSRGMIVAIGGAAAGVGLGIAGLLMLMRGSSTPARTAAASAPAATVVAPAPSLVAAPAPSPAPTPTPSTPPPPVASAEPRRIAPTHRTPAPPSPRSAATVKPRINDGF